MDRPYDSRLQRGPASARVRCDSVSAAPAHGWPQGLRVRSPPVRHEYDGAGRGIDEVAYSGYRARRMSVRHIPLALHFGSRSAFAAARRRVPGRGGAYILSFRSSFAVFIKAISDRNPRATGPQHGRRAGRSLYIL